MNSVLAALFGGAGAGAQSYGASRMREQDQERLAAQRMAELQQQEQARLRLMNEENDEMTAALQQLGVLEPGQRATTRTGPMIQQQQIAKRQADMQAEKDRMARENALRQNRATYNAALQAGRIPKSVSYSDDVNFSEMLKDGRIEDGQSNALMMQSNAIAAQSARAAEAAARAAERSGNSQDNTNTRQLSSEYATRMQKYKDTYDNVATATSAVPAAMKGDGAAQMSVLYGFIKALDMDSAVREGEVDLARKAAPVMARVKSYAEAFARGEAALIPPTLVQQMSTLMSERQQRLLSRADVTRNEYLQRGAAMGVTNDAVFPRLGGVRKATDAELAAAMRETGNDPVKAAALLRARGFQ